MVFRTYNESLQTTKDCMPQQPSRNFSQHTFQKESISGRLSCSQSVASVSTFASISTGTAPRRVRFSEEDEVWFFEVDDLSSVFSSDGLELGQDFASIFDGGRDSGPRQVKRQDSEWEYVGFYDSVKLPQDFNCVLKDGKGDSIPRQNVRRNSTEDAQSLLDNLHKDRAPQMAPRRSSFELEDCLFQDSDEDRDFDDFGPTSHSRLTRHEKGIYPHTEKSSSSPTETQHSINKAKEDQDSPLTTGSVDASPRRVSRRLSIDKVNMPSIVDLNDGAMSPKVGGEVDATTESTTESYTEALQMDDLSEHELPEGTSVLPEHSSMSECECILMSEYTVNTAIRQSIKPLISNWSKGSNGKWKNSKSNRRASTGNFMRPTKVRGHSFDKESDEGQMMAKACLELQKEDNSLSTKSRPRNFSWDHDSLRPGLVRGYSFLDLMEDAVFDDEGFLIPEIELGRSCHL
jgi:hypothetical protein